MQQPITIENLKTEKDLLDNAVNSINVLIPALTAGLPNSQKMEAQVRLIEARHWLRDASESLAKFTERSIKESEAKAAAEAAKQPEVAVDVPAANVVPMNGAIVQS